jgi:hypothetical protein
MYVKWAGSINYKKIESEGEREREREREGVGHSRGEYKKWVESHITSAAFNS